MTKHMKQISSPGFTGRSYKNFFKPRAAGDVRRKECDLVGGDGAAAILTPPPPLPVLVETLAGSEGQRIGEAFSSCDAVRVSSGVPPPLPPPPHDKDSTVASNGDIPSTSDFGVEIEHKTCTCCGGGGQLLSCVGNGCGRSFHLSCVDPPFTYFPPVVWHCIHCVEKKMELGVESVSQGIECVLFTEGPSDDEETEKQYYVKNGGLAPAHGRWIGRRELLKKAPHVYKSYKRRTKRKREWKQKRKWNQPQRLLAKRLLKLPGESNSNENGSSLHEWLVKWTDLGYDEATWELEDAAFLSSPEGMELRNCFETRYKAKEEINLAEENKRRDTCELSDLPSRDPDHLNYVSKVLESWHRHQNALIIDAQERTVVVVLVLLSLLNKVGGPILVVTTSTSLCLWEAEFQRWAATINLIIYQGDRDTRQLIRALEFFNEHGSIMFQVLLSPMNAFAEDVENLKPLKWEVIVIDEFQLPLMSNLAKKIKILAANMKILVDSCQCKDLSISCHNALSLLDPNYDGANEDGHIHASEMKEKLIQFTAYERKLHKHLAVKLTEFWVPVMLSDVQNEQYCASLLSNSALLCSKSKDPPLSIHDLLIATRKTCDHPYLVDGSLRSLADVVKSASDRFNVEIQMSGKLQLLKKILPEIKRCGLRMVILFQAVDGQVTTGDILDDLLQKFDPNSYSRVGDKMSPRKKQAILKVFNDKEKNYFACLLETQACDSSIKLLSVDIVIIFNSDWDPANDLNALKKVTTESQFEDLKIFRLYSPHTVEEKALILAKEGLAVEGNITTVAHKICLSILAWGSSHQFKRLESNTSCSNSLDQTFVEDVILELLALLPCCSAEKDSDWGSNRKSKPKNVLTAPLIGGSYQGKGICLVGESKSDIESNLSADLLLNKPKIFWRELLDGKTPRWKYVSSPSRRCKRKIETITSESEESTIPGKAVKGKRSAGNRRFKKVLEVEDNVPSERANGSAVLQKVATNGNDTRSTDLPCIQPRTEAVESSPGPAALRDFRNGLNDNNNAVDASCSSQLTPPTEGQARGNVDVQPATTLSETIESDAANRVPENMNPSFSHINHSEVLSGQSQAPQSACLDSLQQEMDRLQKAKDEAVKLHEDLDLFLEAECEKKIAEIRSKYDILRQDAAAVMAQTQSELEFCHQMTYKQKLLAEALIQKQHHRPSADMQDPNEVESASVIISGLLRITQQGSGLPTGSTSPVGGNVSAVQQNGTSNPAILEAALIPFIKEQRFVRSSGKNRGLPCIANISSLVSSLSRSLTRAPAPHLRSSLPCPVPPSDAAPEADLYKDCVGI